MTTRPPQGYFHRDAVAEIVHDDFAKTPHRAFPVTRSGISATNAWCWECGFFPLPLAGSVQLGPEAPLEMPRALRATSAERTTPHTPNTWSEWPRLANDIRAEDGNHDLGAGELADRLTRRGWSQSALDVDARIALAEVTARMDAERQALTVIANIIEAAGGQVTVPDKIRVADAREVIITTGPDSLTYTVRTS